MANIVYAWELGSGSAQLSTIGPVLKQLELEGHSVHVVLRDVACNRGWDFSSVHAAPVHVLQGTYTAYSHADIILNASGWTDYFKLYHLTSNWVALFDQLDVDLLIADFAPTAMLAARMSRLPYMAFGQGWSVPPLASPLPALPLRVCNELQIQLSDQQALHAVNQLLNQEGVASLGSLSELWQNAFLYGDGLLEYYDGVVREYAGMLLSEGGSVAPNWKNSGRPKMFVQISPDHKGLDLILETIVGGAYDVIVQCTGLPPALLAKYSELQVVDDTLILKDCIDQADICIASKFGAINHGLHAGTPMILIPENYEQLAYANRVSALEVGMISMPGDRYLKQKIQKQLTTCVRRAKKVKQQLNWNPDKTKKRLIDAINMQLAK